MRANNLPLTKMKLGVARMLYAAVRLFHRTDERVIERRGIRYRVDLSEGIDLSLYLFGTFQKHVLVSGLARLEPGAVVIDVGANLGHMTLSYAKSPVTARVYAFEPTDYAFSKLEANLDLNPDLRKKVVAAKVFVSDESSVVAELQAFSSWPVGARPALALDTHPIHGGVVMPVSGAPSVTLDEFVEKEKLTRVDLIKIDTDGHELQVLRGARRVVKEHKPVIIFEWGQYALRERGVDGADFLKFFDDFDYRLINLSNRHVVTAENYRREIPGKSTTDVLAITDRRKTDLDSPARTLQHRRMLLGKRFLKCLYTEWYRSFLASVPHDRSGAILEIGAGGGFLKQLCPDVIASDIQPLPHCDMAFTADAIPFADSSIRAIGMINVLHHIPNVCRFFAEADRVLVPGGILFMVEPANTAWGRFLFTKFHHESFRPNDREWQFASAGPLSGANGALPWMIFTRDVAEFRRRYTRLVPAPIRLHTPFRYLLSGGFTFRGVAPGFCFRPVTFFERLFTPFYRYCALFQTILVKKTAKTERGSM